MSILLQGNDPTKTRPVAKAIFLLLLLVAFVAFAYLGRESKGILLADELSGEEPRWSILRSSTPWFDKEGGSFSEPNFAVPTDTFCSLNFSAEDQKAIAVIVQRCIERDVLVKEDRIWFPAVFTEGDKRYEVKARLRGDHSVHWAHDQKSWRVRFQKDDLFHGMRVVNFVVPIRRGIVLEALMTHLGRTENLLTFRDGFSHLTVDDGTDYLYYVVESASKEFLEANNKAASAIFHPRDIGYEIRAVKKQYRQFAPFSSVEFFDTNSSDKERKGLYQSVLDRYIQAESLADFESIFDIDKYLVYQALCLLAGTRHSMAAGNHFMYLDPTVGLLEPIVYDIGRGKLNEEVIGRSFELASEEYAMPLWERLVLSDSKNRFKRDRLLWKWVNDGGEQILTTFDTFAGEMLDALKSKVASGGPQEQLNLYVKWLPRIREGLAHNARLISENLAQSRASIKVVFTDFSSADAQHTIRIMNNSFAPLLLERIQIDAQYTEGSAPFKVFLDSNENNVHDASDPYAGVFEFDTRTNRLNFEPEGEAVLYPSFDGRVVLPTSFTLLISGGTTLNRPTRVHYSLINRVTNQPFNRESILDAVVNLEDASLHPKKSYSIDQFLAENLIFGRGPEAGSVQIKPGRHEIRDSIVVPKDLVFYVPAGVELAIAKGHSIFSYSPIHINGNPENPVKIGPLRAGEPWGVLAIVGPQTALSSIQYCHFTGYSEANMGAIFFTGGLSVHSAKLELLHCKFTAGLGEDALNYKRSEGLIQHCEFSNNASDAIDLDWSNVVVENCRFSANQGDAIDLSGTTTTLRHNIIASSGDKGISVGENSSVVVYNCFISGCVTGIASKDLSRTRIFFSTLAANETAIAAYQKKAIFGPAEASARYSLFWQNGELSNTDSFSNISYVSNLMDDLSGVESSNQPLKREFFEDSADAWSLVDNIRSLSKDANPDEFNEFVQELGMNPADVQGPLDYGFDPAIIGL